MERPICVLEMYECERRAHTVAAIKYIRGLRGLGLAEAKSIIDEVYYIRRSVIFAFATEYEAGVVAEHMESLGFRYRIVDEKKSE